VQNAELDLVKKPGAKSFKIFFINEIVIHCFYPLVVFLSVGDFWFQIVRIMLWEA
jgi:hypothetical protein